MPTSEKDGRNVKISELKQEIKVFLKEGFQGDFREPRLLIKYYWEASRKADQLIRIALGEKGRFPVDVWKLAEMLGVQIVEEDLNEFSGWESMNRKIGQIEIGKNPFTDEKTYVIYVDKAAPPSSKRYAIAHELVHYIIHYDDNKDYYEDYCIMPMCPANIEEIVADIFAIFLLIPVRFFFVEFLEYVKRKMEEGRTPVTTERWIRYLAERSVVSDYYVAYGYQQLRYVAYWIYQAWKDKDKVKEDNKDEDENKGKTADSEDSNIMTEEDKKQVQQETEGYYTEEMGKILFE